MTAEIVSVGTELLLGQIADTDAQHLGWLLPQLGIVHTHRQTVGDNHARLTEALKLALSRSDIVFTIGGLGPTQDDLTREGIAAALDDPLIHDSVIEDELRRIFAERRYAWVESQVRQAMRPACATPIPNPNGTAPGLVCRKAGKMVIALPGPRGEFVPMVDGPVREVLAKLSTDGVIVSRILRTCGVGEGVVEQTILELLNSTNPTIAPYAKVGEVHLRITAKSRTEADASRLIAPMEARVRELLGDGVYGVGDESLEQVVIEHLRTTRSTLSVAESCTGGGLGARLTSVPGASDVFAGGVVSYSNDVKVGLLGVEGAIFKEGGPGAVSAECAEQMAVGAQSSLGTTHAVSITGIAGPGGGSEEKPVGTVFVGFADPGGAGSERYSFRGSREAIRERSVQSALILLRKRLRSTPLDRP